MIGHAAAVLRKTFRPSDVVARLGGDEFAVLVLDAGADDPVDRRLRLAIAAFNAESAVPYALSASIGVAHWAAGTALSLDHLLAAATR